MMVFDGKMLLGDGLIGIVYVDQGGVEARFGQVLSRHRGCIKVYPNLGCYLIW
jgi:hypothetical protein